MAVANIKQKARAPANTQYYVSVGAISVPMPGRDVRLRIWRIDVGRVPLYLLDTNIPQNNPDDRQITGRALRRRP